MNTQYIENLIDSKMIQNEEIIIFTFYELRVNKNLTEQETEDFLRLAKIKLENNNYLVYFTGAKYTYKGERKKVENNQLMVAIKE